MENTFNALCSVLAEHEMKALFLESEGVELMVICMREKKLARARSIKVRPAPQPSDKGFIVPDWTCDRCWTTR